MEPRKPKIPAEAVQLYTRYIHGEISRRDFLSAANRFTTAGLTAAANVGRLMPNYALGQQVGRDDERIRATYETVPSPNGNGFIRGYLVRPFSADSRSETPSRLPGVIVIHENRGTESAYRGRGTALCPGQLHGVCAGRADASRGLSEPRLQRRPIVSHNRSRQNDPRFCCRRAMVEITSGLYRPNRCNRFLLRRWYVEHLGCSAGGGFGGSRPILW